MQPRGLNLRPLELISISNKPTQLNSHSQEGNIYTLTSDHGICTSTIISAAYLSSSPSSSCDDKEDGQRLGERHGLAMCQALGMFYFIYFFFYITEFKKI